MNARTQKSLLAAAIVFTAHNCSAGDSLNETTAFSKGITMLEIIDMASDFEHDHFEDLARRIGELPGKSTQNGYVAKPQTLQDDTQIASAHVYRKGGNVDWIEIKLSGDNCFPIRTVVWRTYADRPVYSHDNGRYETITPWTKITFFPGAPGNCLKSFLVEKPTTRDFEVEHLIQATPKDLLDAKSMDALLWLFTKDAGPSLNKIYDIIEKGRIEDSELPIPNTTVDSFKIVFAKKSSPTSKPFAVVLAFSDTPCYPLARALALTRTRIEILPLFDDASRFQSADNDLVTTLYPHYRSPLCLGFIRAYDG